MNYWILYIEFLYYFQDISYKNIPLPLLSQFPKYINSEIINLINNIKNKGELSTNITTHKEIQSYL